MSGAPADAGLSTIVRTVAKVSPAATVTARAMPNHALGPGENV